MDLTYIAGLSAEQKDVLAYVLEHIEIEEPFGPGISSDWVKEKREDLRLSAPRDEDISQCETIKKIDRSENNLSYKVAALADSSTGLPVVTIKGTTIDIDTLFNVNGD